MPTMSSLEKTGHQCSCGSILLRTRLNGLEEFVCSNYKCKHYSSQVPVNSPSPVGFKIYKVTQENFKLN